MDVTEKLNEELKRIYVVTIPKTSLDEKLEKKLIEVKGEIHLKGFRPGKAPISFLKKNYAKKFMGEIVEDQLKSSLEELLTQKNVKPSYQPKIDFEDEIEDVLDGKADLIFTVEFEIIPEFEIKDFSNIKLEKPVYKVVKDDIDEALKEIQKTKTTYNKVDEKSKEGFQLLIDFVGSVDGKEFDGGKAENVELVLGSKKFIPGFEEQLIGVEAGEAKEIKITFPKDYQSKDLAGKDATFAIKIKEVRENKTPEISDEFAKELGLTDLKELENKAKEQIAGNFENRSRVYLKRAVLDELDKQYDFALPSKLVDEEFNNIWDQVQNSPKDEADGDKKEDDLKEEYKVISIRRVRLGLVLAKIGKSLNVQVSKEELQQAVQNQARQMPGQEKMLFDYYQKNPQALTQLSAPIFEDKSVDKVIEKADITEKEVAKEFLLQDPDE